MEDVYDHPCVKCYFFAWEEIDTEETCIRGKVDIPVCNRLERTLTIGKCDKFEEGE